MHDHRRQQQLSGIDVEQRSQDGNALALFRTLQDAHQRGDYTAAERARKGLFQAGWIVARRVKHASRRGS